MSANARSNRSPAARAGAIVTSMFVPLRELS
jgi:hypothetical protein